MGLRLEEARWSGKMRKSPGQDDLHGEEEMDEQFQLIIICKLNKTGDLQVKKKRLGLFLLRELTFSSYDLQIWTAESSVSSLQIPLKYKHVTFGP